ncbi:hypothetical protein Fmac_012112 [Flemingia macrophylla]|uniref:Uncharacterized protein n=1 Tax=Flemingia macrophylla TaxID=520843 RepID=A0ABD1MPS4_9FABA
MQMEELITKSHTQARNESPLLRREAEREAAPWLEESCPEISLIRVHVLRVSSFRSRVRLAAAKSRVPTVPTSHPNLRRTTTVQVHQAPRGATPVERRIKGLGVGGARHRRWRRFPSPAGSNRR